MARWWEGVKRMLGFSPLRGPPLNGDDAAALERKRLADIRDREDARRRVRELDLRVDVLTGRLDKHERKPH